ncbi:MAG: hypothetical protein RL199_1925, partial [Pseudomonadota bacterium]
LVVDESHQTLPQVGAMYRGDQARKQTLVEYGFRLPSALDNRPLKFDEFEKLIHQAVYVSATPAEYELQKAEGVVVEQIIRPTGLVDPQIEIRPVAQQVDDLLDECRLRIAKGERVLVTTLTKRMAEDLTEYYADLGVKVRYLHSDIETLERTALLQDLRRGAFDVLVGINLLREGLDLPEVSLVAILDADKEGFLRSSVSLIQTIGRAARHVNGRVLMYADNITRSMKIAIDETNRRRAIQVAWNEANGVVPTSAVRALEDPGAWESTTPVDEVEIAAKHDLPVDRSQIPALVADLSRRMEEAAETLDFEQAASLRDRIQQLRDWDLGIAPTGVPSRETVGAGRAFTAPAKARRRPGKRG